MPRLDGYSAGASGLVDSVGVGLGAATIYRVAGDIGVLFAPRQRTHVQNQLAANAAASPRLHFPGFKLEKWTIRALFPFGGFLPLTLLPTVTHQAKGRSSLGRKPAEAAWSQNRR